MSCIYLRDTSCSRMLIKMFSFRVKLYAEVFKKLFKVTLSIWGVQVFRKSEKPSCQRKVEYKQHEKELKLREEKSPNDSLHAFIIFLCWLPFGSFRRIYSNSVFINRIIQPSEQTNSNKEHKGS